MDTDKGQAGQLEVIMLDGERWVLAESLHRALGVDGEYDTWFNTVIKEFHLKSKLDYAHPRVEGDALSIGAAQRVIDRLRHKEAIAQMKANPKRRNRRGVEVDEYGNPVHPPRPEKRRGRLITPWDSEWWEGR